MNQKISKTNENLEFFNALIDEIQINGTERLQAKARLAQGEAMATAVVDLYSFGWPKAKPWRTPWSNLSGSASAW